MDKPLSTETQRAIVELSETIASSRQLDAELAEELRGHIEDKVIAYLEGREAITEQDALILAREHFGKAPEIKAMLHRAQPFIMNRTLQRRIMTVAVAQVVIELFIFSVIFNFSAETRLWSIGLYAPNAAVVLGPILLGLALFITQRRIGQGRVTWATAIPETALTAAFSIALAVSSTLVPGLLRVPLPARDALGLEMINVVVWCASCLLWIWWCDQKPRTVESMFPAVVAWTLFTWSRHATALFFVALWNLSISGKPVLSGPVGRWSVVEAITYPLVAASGASILYFAWRGNRATQRTA